MQPIPGRVIALCGVDGRANTKWVCALPVSNARPVGADQKLTYKELMKMFRLRPLSETISGQELLQEERIKLLCELAQEKLALSEEIVASLQQELQKLNMASLHLLFRQILHIDTLEQLEQWIADQIAAAKAKPAKRNRRKLASPPNRKGEPQPS